LNALEMGIIVMRRSDFVFGLGIAVLLSFVLTKVGGTQARKPTKPVVEITTPAPRLPNEELKKLQGVLETSMGEIVIEFYPEKAPAHVNYFVNLAKSGFYNGTTFHRVILRGIIQGGDPLSKDPTKRALYGTGGLRKLKAEFNDVPHIRGTVSAVLFPGEPNSAGSQFFICVSDQPSLNGQYTAWGHVVEGMSVVDKISEVPADANQQAKERVEIKKAYIRPIPPIPFAEATKEEMKRFHVVLDTNQGKIELELYPEVAPEHVRNFLKLCKTGLYDNTSWHRVVPGFVIQGGDLSTRIPPVTPEKLSKLLKNLQAEISELKHEKGTVSMARGEAMDSASTSFFICLAAQPSLDAKYTIFGKVINGEDVIDKISAVPLVEQEKPKDRINLIHAEVIEQP
jgi:cyclophilin family peptidyl-prolyl cis-trans isomerase